MADIISFNPDADEPDIYSMDRGQLENCLQSVRAEIGRLDAREPEDMNGAEYESWADGHERLEDLADEIQDLLDEMRSS